MAKKGECKFIDPNIDRKENMLTKHLSQHKDDMFPLFSLIEFNLSGLCTRKCIFCPRSNEKAFPNINEQISVELYEKIMTDLEKADFDGTIFYSAFSEPLLHEDIEILIKISKQKCPKARVEIVSNGDLVTSEKISKLFEAGLTTLLISMYDGEHQVEHFKKLQKETGLKDEQFILRTRWLPPEDNFGMVLSNRAGAIEMKNVNVVIPQESLKKNCYYPFYQIFVNYDGAVLICPHDWHKKSNIGDIKKQSILEIWDNDILKQARLKLAEKDRNFPPCNLCDAKGELIGKEHFEGWMKYYKNKS